MAPLIIDAGVTLCIVAIKGGGGGTADYWRTVDL